ncbi:MAG: acyl-CoA thioesterase domain-containing protein [Candidatus Nanopelagicales bacterium]
MQAIDISALIRPRPTEHPARFVLAVPAGFQQGRGAWGGLATGAMTAAALLVDPRPELAVRALSAQLVAPVLVGQVDLAVEELRRGSGTNTLAVRMHGDSGDLLAHAVVVLGAARRGPDMPDGADWLGVTPPAALADGPDGVAVIPVGPPMAPDFTAHLEFRPVAGLPYSGAAEDLTEGWIRPRGPQGPADAALVAALADAWWVSVIVRMSGPRPAATVGFTLDLPGDPTALARSADGGLEPLFHRGRSVAARDGFTVEVRELWTRDGRMVSWNTQTVAVIK